MNKTSPGMHRLRRWIWLRASAGTPRPSSPRRIADEAGYTLVEMLVAMSLMLVVVGAPLTWIVLSINQQNTVSSLTYASRAGEIGLEAITRDIHQSYQTPFGTAPSNASSVTIATAGGTTTLSLYLPPTAALQYGQLVTWSCVAVTGCTRTQAGATRTLFQGLSQITLAGTVSTGPGSAPVSTNVNPDYIAVTAVMNPISQLDASRTTPISGRRAITIKGGANLRGFAS